MIRTLYVLALSLALSACFASATEDDLLEEDDGLADVELTTQAVCGAPGNEYTSITSNSGASITAETSYKKRALRAYMMYSYCGVGNNAWTCGADSCTANGGVAPYSLRLTGCFDLPSCAAWDCRECNVQSKPVSTDPWINTGLILRYQQGYGIAKYKNYSSGATFVTTRLTSPAAAWSGD